jgi:hypothetical protein
VRALNPKSQGTHHDKNDDGFAYIGRFNSGVCKRFYDIIPWQNPEGAERLYSPVRGAEIERLKPMDPYSFELETSLHEQWQANKNAAIDLAKD